MPDDETGLRERGVDDVAIRGGGGEGVGEGEGGAGGTEESDKSNILALTAEELITDLNAEAAQSLDPTIHNPLAITVEDDGTAADRQTSEVVGPTEIKKSNDKKEQVTEGLDAQDRLSGDRGNGRAGQKYEYEYAGEWQRGLRHGEGRLLYPTGEEYVGDWFTNVRHGVGVLQAVEFTYEVMLIWIRCARIRSSTLRCA